jgi:hypothetical protein
MRSILITIYATISVVAATAFAAESATPARFEKSGERGAGWVNFSTPEGQFVYGEPEANRVIGGASNKAFSIGGLERKDYEFFSYQEEEALWLVMQDQIAAMQPKPKRKANPNLAAQKMKWPKVVLRDSVVCVPVLESANASDWREHLTCTEVPQHD